MEVCSALYQNGGAARPAAINKIYGLGGRDYMPEQAEQAIRELDAIAKGGRIKAVKEYIGVRE